MEKKIAELIEDLINDFGFDLVKINVNGSIDNRIVEILIESKDGSMIQVGDCQKISRNISAILDVEDIIKGKYFLEVSSAGVERPLVKLADYERFKGRDAKIRLHEAFNGNINFKGTLLGVEEEKIMLQSKNIVLKFDFDAIKNAKLIMTDKLFRELLKGNKK